MGKIGFIAFFYVIGIAFFGLGLVDLFFDVRFALLHEEGTMTSADPNIALVAKLPEKERLYGTTASVVYTTTEGRLDVPGQRLSGQIAERLARGEAIPVRFLRSDPTIALFDSAEQRVDWTGLLAGAAALAVAIFAHRLMRREAGVG